MSERRVAAKVASNNQDGLLVLIEEANRQMQRGFSLLQIVTLSDNKIAAVFVRTRSMSGSPLVDD